MPVVSRTNTVPAPLAILSFQAISVSSSPSAEMLMCISFKKLKSDSEGAVRVRVSDFRLISSTKSLRVLFAEKVDLVLDSISGVNPSMEGLYQKSAGLQCFLHNSG